MMTFCRLTQRAIALLVLTLALPAAAAESTWSASRPQCDPQHYALLQQFEGELWAAAQRTAKGVIQFVRRKGRLPELGPNQSSEGALYRSMMRLVDFPEFQAEVAKDKKAGEKLTKLLSDIAEFRRADEAVRAANLAVKPPTAPRAPAAAPKAPEGALEPPAPPKPPAPPPVATRELKESPAAQRLLERFQDNGSKFPKGPGSQDFSTKLDHLVEDPAALAEFRKNQSFWAELKENYGSRPRIVAIECIEHFKRYDELPSSQTNRDLFGLLFNAYRSPEFQDELKSDPATWAMFQGWIKARGVKL